MTVPLQLALAAAFAADTEWASLTPDVGTGIITGNINVLNLVGATSNIHHQDQLIYIPPPPGDGNLPVPEPMSLFVWSLLAGCVGVSISRRRAA